MVGSLILLCLVVIHKPFAASNSNELEIFNEICIYALTVNFLLFTEYEENIDTRWGAGYLADGIILANFVINLVFVTFL